MSAARKVRVQTERVTAHRLQIRKRVVASGLSFIGIFLLLIGGLVYLQVARDPNSVLGNVPASMQTVKILSLIHI